jgi:hypothetical protein
LQAALHDATPFLGGEWFFASRTGFANVAALWLDNAVGPAGAHYRNAHATRHNYKRMLDACGWMLREHQRAVKGRIGKALDRGVYVVLAITGHARWTRLGAQGAATSDIFAHSQDNNASAFIGESNGGFREGCLAGIVGDVKPTFVFD